jgi:NAD(P)-dependent dehydrogenase (short-subunit alcohol dehydrogenase family)
MSPVVFDDIQFENRDYHKWLSYGQSKTANILFAVELNRRLADKGVYALAVHPGVIQTELSRHMEPEDFEMMQKRVADTGGGMQFKSVEAGSATSVYAATAPELEGRGGVYLEDCHVAAVDDDNPKEGVRSYAVDPENAKKLWAISEELVDQSFDF